MWTHLAFILKPLKLSYVILCHCILVYYIDGLSSKKCSQAKSFSPSFIICTFHPKPHTSIWCSCHCGHALSGRIETIDSQNLILFQTTIHVHHDGLCHALAKMPPLKSSKIASLAMTQKPFALMSYNFIAQLKPTKRHENRRIPGNYIGQ